MRRFFKRFREKINAFLDRIPRKTQVAVNILLMVVLPLLIYVFVGGPALSPEHGLRRAEKENLVGPGRILGIEEIDGMYSDTLVIAKTEEGVILYTHWEDAANPIDPLVYREQTGDIMVCGVHQSLSSITPPDGDDLTVIVFDDYPEAVRAELNMQIFWEDRQTGQQWRYLYLLSGERTNQGYFRMDHDVQWHESFENPENQAIHAFTNHAWNEAYRAPAGEFPATVRLYDKNDTLICQRELWIFPQEN